jgi:hypothetical protein
MVRIIWQGKYYGALNYEELLKLMELDSWFGSLDALVLRVSKYYGAELDCSSAQAIFEHLERLGELKIIK